MVQRLKKASNNANQRTHVVNTMYCHPSTKYHGSTTKPQASSCSSRRIPPCRLESCLNGCSVAISTLWHRYGTSSGLMQILASERIATRKAAGNKRSGCEPTSINLVPSHCNPSILASDPSLGSSLVLRPADLPKSFELAVVLSFLLQRNTLNTTASGCWPAKVQRKLLLRSMTINGANLLKKSSWAFWRCSRAIDRGPSWQRSSVQSTGSTIKTFQH